MNLIEAAEKALRIATGGRAKKLVTDHERQVLNAFLFIALCSYDLSVFGLELATGKSDAKRRVYARLVAMHCVEFFDSIAPLVISSLKSDTSLRGIAEEGALHSAAGLLKPLRRKYDRYLRTLRGNVIAHRNLDGLKQVDLIRGIDEAGLVALVTDLFGVQAQLLSAYMALGVRMSRRLSGLLGGSSGLH